MVWFSQNLSAQLLDIESKVLPVIVSVSGRVGSETPISCEYSGLRGVIVEETVRLYPLFHIKQGDHLKI